MAFVRDGLLLSYILEYRILWVKYCKKKTDLSQRRAIGLAEKCNGWLSVLNVAIAIGVVLVR
jgi:hypothetical protein